MTKFNKTMTDDEFLQALHQLDTMELIEAFNEINDEDSYKIYYAREFIDMVSDSDDIRILLELQRDLPDKNIYDYDYIITGPYYFQTDVSNDIFDLLNENFDNGWLEFKDELIEYFS